MPNLQVIDEIYTFLERALTPVVILYGGAGAGKSWTMAQFLICDILFKMPARVLITRKYNPSLRLTTYTLVKDILDSLQLPYEENKFEQLFVFPNGARLYMRGLDEPSKIQSAEFNFVWMEEAMEFTYKDYQQLKLRLRRRPFAERPNQIFLTFNPTRRDWIYKIFFTKERDDVSILHTTYKMNPFLTGEYKATIEGLKEEDETAYKIFGKGEFAENTNLVYTNYTVSSNVPSSFDFLAYGVDFGYNNPTVVLKIGVKDKVIYVLEEFYRTQITNQQLIEVLKEMGVGNLPLYCDSAEPARIRELQLAGFNAQPSRKSKIKDEIDQIKRMKIVIHPKCVNTLKEIEAYSWKLDKAGTPLDEPVKFMDHAMDAMRYAVCSMFQQHSKFSVAKPII